MRTTVSRSGGSAPTDNQSGVSTVTGRAWTVQTLTSILTSPRIADLRTHRGKVVSEGQ